LCFLIFLCFFKFFYRRISSEKGSQSLGDTLLSRCEVRLGLLHLAEERTTPQTNKRLRGLVLLVALFGLVRNVVGKTGKELRRSHLLHLGRGREWRGCRCASATVVSQLTTTTTLLECCDGLGDRSTRKTQRDRLSAGTTVVPELTTSTTPLLECGRKCDLGRARRRTLQCKTHHVSNVKEVVLWGKRFD